MPNAIVSLREHGLPDRIESKAVTFVGPDLNHISLLFDRKLASSEQLTRATAFAVSAYCYTAMMWRAARMAAAPLMVVEETDDGEEWIKDHRLVPFLAMPRPDLGFGELLERTQLYRDATGAALWETGRNQLGEPQIVTPFSADEFRTASDPVKGLIYGRYEIRRADGTWRSVDRETVIHFRETNPASWRTPVSRLETALLQLDLGHNVDRIVHTFLRKAMFPGGVISPDAEWNPTESEWKIWKEQVAAWWTGPAMQGAPLIVPGKTNVAPVSTGMRDLLPEPILDRVEATVGAVFGTPPVVLGWLSGMKNSPWSQMSEARRQTYEDTIEPLWESYSRLLTAAYLTTEEIAAGQLIRFDTSRIRALMSDAEQQARIGALASDVLTVNDRRVMMGKDPLPANDPRGEVIVGLTFLGDIGLEVGSGERDGEGEGDADEGTTPAPDATAAAAEGNVAATALNGAQVAALLEIVGQVTAGTLPPGSASAIIAAAFPLLTLEQIDAIMGDLDPGSNPPAPAPTFGAPAEDDEGDDNKPDDGDEEEEEEEDAKYRRGPGRKSADTKDLVWLLFDIESKAAEGGWERTIYANLQSLKTSVVALARRHLSTKAEEPSPESVRRFTIAAGEMIERNGAKLAAMTYPLLVKTGGRAVRRLGARIGLAFDVLEPGLLKYAKEESAFLSSVMGKTTGKAVAGAVQAGLDAGDTIRGLIERLEALPAFDRPRAKLTARTETTRAWNGAQRRSMSEYERTTGHKATKSWLSARDARVRDEHIALDDGRWIPIDAAFANGLTEPGEPNCRCTLLYGFAEPGEPDAVIDDATNPVTE